MPVEQDTFCEVVDVFTPPFCIPIPGGGELCARGVIGALPVPADICSDLLGQVNVALAGLAPVMCLIDVALALIDVAKAIPDSLGPPPQPTALIEAVAALVEKAACLLPLVPQLSICPMIKAILNMLIQCINDIIQQVENLVVLRTGVANQRAILDALDTEGEFGLDLTGAYDALDCEEQNLNLLVEALSGSTESIQRLLDITVNPLLKIANLEPIEFADINFGDLDAVQDALVPLRAATTGLAAVRDLLPC